MQLRLQDSILFAQELNDIVLLSLKPTEERGEHEMKRDHGQNLPDFDIDGVSRHYAHRASGFVRRSSARRA